jgi:4-amino-4-deoxy-L-arabinose transferase-like glycosyltransferase
MNDKNYLLVILIVCIAIFLPHLHVIEVNIMEARNFVTAREMLDYGNWIHTTMNLEPRYEKPPLPTWLTAISASIFGVKNLFGLRLPAVLAVIFLIFTFYFLQVEISKNKKQAFFGTLILATSFYIIFSGRNGQWDIFAHSFMLFAIYQLFKAFESKSVLWKKWILAGVFMGLSFMSKGPVSHFALLLPFIISYGIVFKYKHFKRKLSPLIVSLIIFALVGLTWGLYIYLTDLSSAQAIADKETTAWSNRNTRPFYYYWSFFTQSGVWTFFAFIALLYPYMIKRVTDKKMYRFSLLWTIIAVLLLSLIPEKKSRYLLPVLIPLAWNTSFFIYYLIEEIKHISKLDKYLAYFGYGLIGLIGLAFPIGGYMFLGEKLDGFWLWYILASVVLFTIGIFIFYTLKKNNFEKAFYAVITFIAGIMVFALPLAKTFYDNEDYLSMSSLRGIENMKNIKLYSTDKNLPTPELIFELGEPIKRVNSPNELPDQSVFGLLVRDTIPEDVNNYFTTKFIAQFDENHIKKGKRGYRARKTLKLYLLEKK